MEAKEVFVAKFRCSAEGGFFMVKSNLLESEEFK